QVTMTEPLLGRLSAERLINGRGDGVAQLVRVPVRDHDARLRCFLDAVLDRATIGGSVVAFALRPFRLPAAASQLLLCPRAQLARKDACRPFSGRLDWPMLP